MKKSTVLLFSSVVLGLSWLGYYTQSYYLDILLSDNPTFFYARLLLVFCLLTFVLFYKLRTHTVKLLVGLSGVALFLVAFITVFSPNLFGYFDYYVPLGDTFIFTEGGILAALASDALPGHRSKLYALLTYKFRQFQIFFARPKLLSFDDDVKPVTSKTVRTA